MIDYSELKQDAQDQIDGHEITCDPSAVLSLIAESERLSGCDKAYAEVWEKARGLQSEMDVVMAENEALRKDAERYRFVTQHVRNHGWFVALESPTGISIWTGPSANAMIDVAMAEASKP